MNLADSLRKKSTFNPQTKKRELLKKVEENPTDISNMFALYVEEAVESSGKITSEKKERGIRGYLVCSSNYDRDRFSYSINDGELNKLGDSGEHDYVVVDKVRVDSNGKIQVSNKYWITYNSPVCRRGYVRTTDGTIGPRTTYDYPNELVLSQVVVDNICAAVRTKLSELGFQHYKVEARRQELYKQELKYRIFGDPKKIYCPFATTTLLWIEVNW